ncbi:PepSY domain-containing protein [Candidatus Woesearchaeota archaeon]|nr:PepSY domain-containing protein [Candidatus Woesearchaeota archaeon]
MNIHQVIAFVEHSKKCKDFKKAHEHYYLVHCFCTIENKQQSPWQIGYYSRETERIVSFTAGKEVLQGEEDETFTKQGHVPALDAGKIKVSLEDALAKAEDFRQRSYNAESVTKTIIILQTIDDVPVWNVTLVTHAFSLLNVRVHAGSGKVISTIADSVLNLGQRT